MDGWANGQKYWTNGPSWPDYHRMLQDTFINMFSLVVTFVMCYRSHHATEVIALQKS